MEICLELRRQRAFSVLSCAFSTHRVTGVVLTDIKGGPDRSERAKVEAYFGGSLTSGVGRRSYQPSFSNEIICTGRLHLQSERPMKTRGGLKPTVGDFWYLERKICSVCRLPFPHATLFPIPLQTPVNCILSDEAHDVEELLED